MSKSNTEQINELEIVENVFSEYLKELKKESSLMRDLYAKGKVEDEHLFHVRMIEVEGQIKTLMTFGFKARAEINKAKNAEAGYKMTPPTTLFQAVI